MVNEQAKQQDGIKNTAEKNHANELKACNLINRSISARKEVLILKIKLTAK